MTPPPEPSPRLKTAWFVVGIIAVVGLAAMSLLIAGIGP